MDTAGGTGKNYVDFSVQLGKPAIKPKMCGLAHVQCKVVYAANL